MKKVTAERIDEWTARRKISVAKGLVFNRSGEGEEDRGRKKTSVFGLCASSPCLFFLSFHRHTPSPSSPSFSREKRSRKSQWRWVTLEMLLGRLVWIRAVSWQTGKPRRDAQCLVNRLHVQPRCTPLNSMRNLVANPPPPTLPSS